MSTDEPRLGDRVGVRLRVPHPHAAGAVYVRTVVDGEPRWASAHVDRQDEFETWWRAEIEVANPITRYRWLLTQPHRWITQQGMCTYDPTDAADFRLVAHSAPPAWSLDAVFYQVFPDRFARASDPAHERTPWPSWSQPAAWSEEVQFDGPGAMTQLYGGNFDGLAERVDHLIGLGINAVYCTPFFPADSNHRYNASTFAHVDPMLGGDDALIRAIGALHARGIRFIGDLTTNHCGSTHEWFRRAQADADAEENGYFVFRRHPDDYECWFGIKSLPKFNHHSLALAARLYDGPGSVAARFLRPPFSMDGWRIDVANMTGRLGDVDANHDVGRALRRTLAADKPDAYLLAEHAHDASLDLDGDGWYSTMNYAGFANPVWSWLGVPSQSAFLGMPVPMPLRDGHNARATIDAFAAAVSWRTRTHNLNLLDSHDSARFRTVVGSDPARQEVGLGMLMTFPGVPCIFQGDELGMEADHSHRARRPLPWHRPETWDQRTLASFRSLIALRRTHRALSAGGFRWASVGPDHFAYLRELADERLLVVARRADVRVSTAAASLTFRSLGLSDEARVETVYGPEVASVDRPARALDLSGPGPSFAVVRLG